VLRRLQHTRIAALHSTIQRVGSPSQVPQKGLGLPRARRTGHACTAADSVQNCSCWHAADHHTRGTAASWALGPGALRPWSPAALAQLCASLTSRSSHTGPPFVLYLFHILSLSLSLSPSKSATANTGVVITHHTHTDTVDQQSLHKFAEAKMSDDNDVVSPRSWWSRFFSLRIANNLQRRNVMLVGKPLTPLLFPTASKMIRCPKWLPLACGWGLVGGLALRPPYR